LLVIAGCDPAKFLEPAEHAPDRVALAVGARVVRVRPLAPLDGWDHRHRCVGEERALGGAPGELDEDSLTEPGAAAFL